MLALADGIPVTGSGGPNQSPPGRGAGEQFAFRTISPGPGDRESADRSQRLPGASHGPASSIMQAGAMGRRSQASASVSSSLESLHPQQRRVGATLSSGGPLNQAAGQVPIRTLAVSGSGASRGDADSMLPSEGVSDGAASAVTGLTTVQSNDIRGDSAPPPADPTAPAASGESGSHRSSAPQSTGVFFDTDRRTPPSPGPPSSNHNTRGGSGGLQSRAGGEPS